MVVTCGGSKALSSSNGFVLITIRPPTEKGLGGLGSLQILSFRCKQLCFGHAQATQVLGGLWKLDERIG